MILNYLLYEHYFILVSKMPSKRSKSKEREKKRRYRSKMSFEEKKIQNEAMKDQMANMRLFRREEEIERFNTIKELKDEKDIKAAREAECLRKKKIRAEMTTDEIEDEKIKTRIRVRSIRSRIPEEHVEFNKIEKRHKMREKREGRTGKEHLQDNLKSQKGMEVLRKEGRLKIFTERSEPGVTELKNWQIYCDKRNANRRFLRTVKPDIVQKLNEKQREEKEKVREKRESETKREEKRKDDEERDDWAYNAEYGEYYWVGEGDPVDDGFDPNPLTEQQWLEIRNQEEMRLEQMVNEKKIELREKRRHKNLERQIALNSPIDPFPEKELCEYEKLRERNIKEREQAMAESGFFEDLLDFKKKIGL